MMKDNTFKEWAIAMMIFSRYDETEYPISGDHDIIYASQQEPGEMEQADVRTLHSFGWNYDPGISRWYKGA